MRRSAAALAALAFAAGLSSPADARAAATLAGGTVVFFADTLSLVARGGAQLSLADGTRVRADAAYVDLKTNRAVFAGHARIERHAAGAGADAIAVDLVGDRVDLLDAASGVTRTTRALGTPAAAEFDAQRFAFPDVDDRAAFIRSRHAAIVPHADVRFTPASFPTSVGGVPVPTYLYTFATGAGFASSSLPGATFDQPYGLFGSPTSLTALHARWDAGPGAALALQQQVVSGDDAYLTASVDAPLSGASTRGFNAYRRFGAHLTASADATSTIYGALAHVGLKAALGTGGAAADYTHTSGGFSSFTVGLRTADRPLIAGATWRLVGDFGFDAQRGGLLYQLPSAERNNFSTVWRHGVEADFSTPTVRLPLGVTIATSYSARRTWYAFPHHDDELGASGTASRPLTRNVTLFAGYQGAWSANVYPGEQGLFYPSPSTPILTPDGTPYDGYAAFSGASTLRAQNVDLQFTPNGNTSFRLSVVHTADFPQFNGYGRPRWEARSDVRFRPFPNIGLDVGRAYDFAWGGTHWTPRWSFAITP